MRPAKKFFNFFNYDLILFLMALICFFAGKLAAGIGFLLLGGSIIIFEKLCSIEKSLKKISEELSNE